MSLGTRWRFLIGSRLPEYCTLIALLLCDIVEMHRRQVLNSKHLGPRGSKGGDDLEIAIAFVAHLHPHFFALFFSIQITERIVIFVPAIHTLQPGEHPVRSALSATQMFDQIVFLQLGQRRAGAAYETLASVPGYPPRPQGLIVYTMREEPA